MDDEEFNMVQELGLDLSGDFSDVDFTDEQLEKLEWARTNLWHTLALLTTAVPETCDGAALSNMHKGLKACLMLRNTIRATVLEATDQPIPTPEELEAYREQITASKETIH